jgi:hypothetical protein
MKHLEGSAVGSRFVSVEHQTEFILPVAVCAWCKPGSTGTGSTVLSHGICPRHLRKMRSQMEKQSRKARK